jgi:hypothetical protein
VTSPGHESDDESAKIQVTDRRRFTETGDERQSPAEEPGKPAAPDPVASQPPSAKPAPAPPGGAARASGADGAATLGPPEAGELGIQTVFLIFWQSAMLALGAEDATGRRMAVDLAEARQAIGLLRVLQQATRGNLTEEEGAALDELLADAQMRYVAVAQAQGGRQ